MHDETVIHTQKHIPFSIIYSNAILKPVSLARCIFTLE